MTLTRAQAEAVLVNRCGPFLEAAGLAVTTAGTNADLNDVIRRTLALMGYAPATIVAADSDLALLITSDLVEEFLDRAEVRALETCQGRLADPSLMVEGLIQVQSADVGRAVTAALAARTAAVRLAWGDAGAGSALGVQPVSFAFQERSPLSSA